MIEDVLAALPAAMETMLQQTGQWVCLGTIERREHADTIRGRLGPQFEFIAEPLDGGMTSIGAHPWVKRTTWEIWARAVPSPVGRFAQPPS